MKSYVEFKNKLSKEVVEKSDELFNEIFAPYENHQPLVCVSRHKDDVKYVRKVNLDKKEFNAG